MQITTQNDSRRHLIILLIIGVLFLSPDRGVRANPESQPERTADSETVESKVWESLISRCASGDGDYIPDDNLSDRRLDSYSWPEGAKAVARRARRCQDRVRRRLHRVAAQCLDERSARDFRQRMARAVKNDRHRQTVNTVYYECRDQYYGLLESYNECCTVIPGY